MRYLIDKSFRQISLDTWFDEEERLWLCQGTVCWNPDIVCKEGEEEQHGYIVADIPEEEIISFALNGEDEDLYYINGKVLPRNQVRIIFSLWISHSDFPDQRQIKLPLSNMQIAAYQEFIVQEFSKFKAAHPDDAQNDSLWHNWLEDAFAEADFKVELPNAMNPVPAHVDYIDFDHPNVECI